VITPSFLPEVVAQHAEEVPFLWLRRDRYTRAPHVRLEDLERLDDRLDAHLDGLLVAGEGGRDIAAGAWGPSSAGEVFGAAVLALAQGDAGAFGALASLAASDPEGRRGLAHALAWVDHDVALPFLRSLDATASAEQRAVAIDCHEILGLDPGRSLNHAIESADLVLRTSAHRAAGSLARADLRSALHRAWDSADPSSAAGALVSSAVLGDVDAALRLTSAPGAAGSEADAALALAFRCLPPSVACDELRRLAGDPSTIRAAVIGAGAAGDAAQIPWILDLLDDPVLARVAFEAFTNLTGAVADAERLAGGPLPGAVEHPNDDPSDDAVDLPADEELPWPAPSAVWAWWDARRSDFPLGTRILCGQAIHGAALRGVLAHRYQRQRVAAAIELQRIGSQPRFPTGARGRLQRDRLGRA